MISPLLLFLTLSNAADADGPSIHALRLPEGETIRVDGHLDEAVWQISQGATGFRQREPQEGAAASEPTEVRVVYDRHTLYVGVLARDREPTRIISRILQRDQVMGPGGFDGGFGFSGDDGVAVLLDPFHDRRNAVVFATNPNGAEFDALVTDERNAFNVEWRGVWHVAARRVAQGWSAEFAIPFRTLRYPDATEARSWGFNVYRVIRRKNEETLWSGWTREGGGFHRVSRAGRLEGLSDLPRPRLNLEAKPFGLVGTDQERAGSGDVDLDGRFDGGIDLKYEVRPGLVLDATVNPDFAQVEADAQQVNLTRFDLFFPEKREFFLENAGIFDFGFRGLGEPPPLLLLFSRRIGIAEDEGEVPVVAGVRLTGRAGRQTLGLLDVYTDRAFGEAPTNFGVLRVKHDVGRSHYVGAMLTDRRSSHGSNTAVGADGSFWLSSGLNLQAFAARTITSGTGGDGNAYRVALDYTGDRYGFLVHHLGIGPEVDAQMGFVTRTDIRRTELLGRRTFRPAGLGLRKIDVFMGGQYITRTDGVLQDWNGGPFVNLEWNSGENLGVFWGPGFSRLDEGFDLSDRVPVPPGDYDGWAAGGFASTSRKRPVVLGGQALLLHSYGGDIRTFGGGIDLSASSHLATSVGVTRNSARLPGGAFDADLLSLRVGYAVSTRLNMGALIQYNSLDKELVVNLRLHFIHRPGSDLFVALNEERGSERSAWDFARRRVALKLTYLVRF